MDNNDVRRLTDRDLLIRIDEKVKGLETWTSNHSKHHWFVEAGLTVGILLLVARLFILKG
ncbi:unnamed protein product [marine sediment metagenome]|uniref:Uncharacterized protein n=1 Tax=marine sediment metagenome TaxID=412755 RepID=X0UVV5_9ZZZZ